MESRINELLSVTEKGISRLKELGADTARVTASVSVTHEFNVDSGNFSLFRTLFDRSLGMMAIKEGKKGVYATNKTDDEDIINAAEQCIAVAESATPDEAWALAPDGGHIKFYEENTGADLDKLFERSVELVETIKKNHPTIIIEQMIVTHGEKEGVYRNTMGALYETKEGFYGVDLMFSAHDGENCSSFFGVGVTTEDLDTPFYALGSIKRDLASVEKQVVTRPVDGKFTGTILLTPDAFAGFMGSIIGNFAGDRSVLEKTSIWLDKVGEKVADERLTVSFPVQTEGIVGRDNYTAEGFLCEDFTIIDKGVLTAFPLSLYVANKTGRNPVKNSLDCMVITPGEKSFEEIVKGIDEGLLVGRFSGGAPGVSGEFSGVAKNSFLIENGKITTAVSETMISGNMAEMINNLVELSSEVIADGTSLLPYAAFSGITISGKAADFEE